MSIQKKLKVALGMSFLIGLTACGSQQENYTVDYLVENDDIRTQVLEDCKANKQTSDNCKNGNEAELRKSAKATKDKLLGSH